MGCFRYIAERPPEILELDVIDSGTGQILLQSTGEENKVSKQEKDEGHLVLMEPPGN